MTHHDKLQVVSLSGAQKASLHPDDMLLLSNFVISTESFRYSTDLVWKPCIVNCQITVMVNQVRTMFNYSILGEAVDLAI